MNKGHHEIETALTLCNALWGSKLSYTQYRSGDPTVPFHQLWPSTAELIEVYRDANLEFAIFELCKLLLVTGAVDHLISLLDAKVLVEAHNFSFGEDHHFSLTHLACAVGCKEVVSRLASDKQVFNCKDHDDHAPMAVCFNAAVRVAVPARWKMFRKALVGQPLRAQKKKEIFEQSREPNNFYKVIVELQRHLFDINSEQNESGDLLVHVATVGGLPSLSLILFIVVVLEADINKRNAKGLTPLSLACSHGYDKVAEVMLCVLGADIGITDNTGRTPLHYAAKNGHAKTVDMLLQRGVDAGREDTSGCVAELLARQRKEVECAQIINRHLSGRLQHLTSLAQRGELEVASLYPSDHCVVNSDGHTLLMAAVLHDQKHLVQQLCSHDLCPRDFVHCPSKKTAVTMAADLRHVECLKVLLDTECSANVMDSRGFLPLHYAASNKSALCAELITKHQSGLQGLHLAKQLASDDREITCLLDNAQMRRQKEIVNPSLFEASIHGDKNCVLYYKLEKGDDLNFLDEDGDWPLLKATKHGHYHVVKLLCEVCVCERGGNVTGAHQRTGVTPLHAAAKAGRCDIAQLLLEHGGGQVEGRSTINQLTCTGETALELAADQGHGDVVSLLLDHGASTALPDSTGTSLLNIPIYPGVQFRIDQHRRTVTNRIVQALQRKVPLKEFRPLWEGPHFHNYRDRHGDTMVMVAVDSSVRVDLLTFLLESASRCHVDLLLSCVAIEPDNSDDDSGLSDVAGSIKQPYKLPERRPLTAIDFTAFHPKPVPDPAAGDHVILVDGELSGAERILRLTSALDGHTSLHRAVKMNNLAFVKLLLEYDKSCANCQDHHGNTPLHLACQQQANQKMVYSLMEHTDLTRCNKQNKIAEDLCFSKKICNELSKRRQEMTQVDADLTNQRSATNSGYQHLPTPHVNTNPFDSRREIVAPPPRDQIHVLDKKLKQLKAD